MAAESRAISKSPFLSSADEVRLTGSTETRIPTALGHINVRVGGKEGAPAMVFWPSLMMTNTMWSYQFEHYVPRYRVVLIDSPGVGKSDALRKMISLEDCAGILVQILDALKIEKCFFLGNSWGAMLAAVLPAWIPERLYGTAVINGTASLPTTMETVVMTLRANALWMYEKTPKWWVDTAKGAFAGDTAEASNPEFIDYIDCVYQDDPKSLSWQLHGILLNRVDRHALLRTIEDVPVLVIAGEEDRQFAVHICRKMANAVPGCKFVVLPETAHLAARENPTAVNAEIDQFIAERLPAFQTAK